MYTPNEKPGLPLKNRPNRLDNGTAPKALADLSSKRNLSLNPQNK